MIAWQILSRMLVLTFSFCYIVSKSILASLFLLFLCIVFNINSLFFSREDAYYSQLWKMTATYFFENIYLPAAQSDNSG